MKAKKSYSKKEKTFLILVTIWVLIYMIIIILPHINNNLLNEEIRKATVTEVREDTLKIESGELLGDKEVFEIKKPLFASPKKGDKINISINNNKVHFKYIPLSVLSILLITIFIPFCIFSVFLIPVLFYVIFYLIIDTLKNLIKK